MIRYSILIHNYKCMHYYYISQEPHSLDYIYKTVADTNTGLDTQSQHLIITYTHTHTYIYILYNLKGKTEVNGIKMSIIIKQNKIDEICK